MFSSARAGLPLRQGQREPPLSDNRVGSGLAAKVGFRLSTRVRPSISTRATAGMGLALEGDFHEAGEPFEVQSWLRLPAGSTLRAEAGPEGAKVWVKTGHLLNIEGVNRL